MELQKVFRFWIKLLQNVLLGNLKDSKINVSEIILQILKNESYIMTLVTSPSVLVYFLLYLFFIYVALYGTKTCLFYTDSQV